MVKVKSDATSAISCRISAACRLSFAHAVWRLSPLGALPKPEPKERPSERYKHSKENGDTYASFPTKKETQIKTIKDGAVSFSSGSQV